MTNCLQPIVFHWRREISLAVIKDLSLHGISCARHDIMFKINAEILPLTSSIRDRVSR
jgi:hypothetical protein